MEISGGEAQKIALARALYKDAPFVILDEPTAALDPVAEFEVYSRMNEIVGDKTALPLPKTRAKLQERRQGQSPCPTRLLQHHNYMSAV